jgi:hypothetical protein
MPCRLAGAQPIAMPPDPSEWLPHQLALAFSSAGWIFSLHDDDDLPRKTVIQKKMWEKSTPPNLPPFQAVRIF